MSNRWAPHDGEAASKPKLVLVPEEIARRLLRAEDIIADPARVEEVLRAGALPTGTAAPELSPLVRRAIHVTVTAQRPLRTVRRLAERCGCSRMTLWRMWHASQQVGDIRLIDLVRLGLLFRYETARKSGATGAQACARIGLDPRTVRRYRRRLAETQIQRLWSLLVGYNRAPSL